MTASSQFNVPNARAPTLMGVVEVSAAATKDINRQNDNRGMRMERSSLEGLAVADYGEFLDRVLDDAAFHPESCRAS